jgi:hypothetical protein
MTLKSRLYEAVMQHHPTIAAVVVGLYVAVGWIHQDAIGRTAFLTGGIIASFVALVLLFSELVARYGGEPA